MARTFAQIKVAIWSDDLYRSLTWGAQWLYKHLLTSPKLSLAGVADWRPARIATFASDLTKDQVESAADELIELGYLIVDDETEECVIRSFIRNDGLLKQPKMGVAVLKAYGEIASNNIRAVIISELRRVLEEDPSTPGLGPLKDLL